MHPSGGESQPHYAGLCLLTIQQLNFLHFILKNNMDTHQYFSEFFLNAYVAKYLFLKIYQINFSCKTNVKKFQKTLSCETNVRKKSKHDNLSYLAKGNTVSMVSTITCRIYIKFINLPYYPFENKLKKFYKSESLLKLQCFMKLNYKQILKQQCFEK